MRPGGTQPALTIADMLARELISLHERPREVPPFSERYAGLTAEDGYRAARVLHQHRVGQAGARWAARSASPTARSGSATACISRSGARCTTGRCFTRAKTAHAYPSPV